MTSVIEQERVGKCAFFCGCRRCWPAHELGPIRPYHCPTLLGREWPDGQQDPDGICSIAGEPEPLVVKAREAAHRTA